MQIVVDVEELRRIWRSAFVLRIGRVTIIFDNRLIHQGEPIAHEPWEKDDDSEQKS